jgi:hypothetical protein
MRPLSACSAETLESRHLPDQRRSRIAIPVGPGVVGQAGERLRDAGSMWQRHEGRRVRHRTEIARIRAEDRVRELFVGDRQVPVRHGERDALAGDLLEPAARHGLRPTEPGVVVVDDPQRLRVKVTDACERVGSAVSRLDQSCGARCRLHDVAA